ncbi:hypothetical protein BH20ACT19_BH20ACT19_00350 [soil metagenome]
MSADQDVRERREALVREHMESENEHALPLEGYVERIVDRDIPDDAGAVIRNPAALRRWMVRRPAPAISANPPS